MFRKSQKIEQIYYRSTNLLIFNARFKSSQTEIPVIKIPKYLENDLGNAIYYEHQKVKETQEKQRLKVTNILNQKYFNKKIISWTRARKLFHYYGRQYDPKNLSLISKFFLKETSNGERIIIHDLDANPSLMTINGQQERSFQSLGLNENLVQSIYDLVNKGKPIQSSVIQYAVIPPILQFRNVIFSAETGSGKTLAYLAPLIQMIQNKKKLNLRKSHKTPYGLVVSPSRELTEQIGNVAKHLCSNTDVGVATMIGGLRKHINQTGLDLVVTTIGLVELHLNNGVYSLRNLNHIVLDEVDTLLDDSFVYETMNILEKLNTNHGQNEMNVECEAKESESHVLNGTQLIFSSATMPKTLHSTIGSLINMQEDIDEICTKNFHTLHPNIKHTFYRVNRFEKDIKLMELMFECRSKKSPVIVFANRSNAVNWLFHFLNENGFQCVRLTSSMDEEERLQSFQLFQQGEYDILVSTDLGSCGLDTNRVRHVINYDCPHYVADYIHRSGRTGRLGSSFVGKVSTFISFKPDAYMLMELERSIRKSEPISNVNANIKAQIRQKRADKYNDSKKF